jgi:AcrR family transcriptional regulator
MQNKRGYHHGSLKQALIDAALEILAEGGPAALTLTEAARRAGVSPAAPYRHFSGRDALISELARRGFETFGARIETAWDEGRPDAKSAMRAMCAAYLKFAQDEPGLYAAMFGQAQTLADPGAGGARYAALQIWSLAHGVAMLTISGHFDPVKSADPALLLDSAAQGVMERAAARAKA